ncbi:hypothetical protein DICPUDRAFT_90119 [Dictyostelium purpureum]|uniref:RING-type domain-containing protein n=1 Tax=Dictyostelium purpureum TaxID=5786 RepID=F1A0G6_DICPU|nr:uncharacterized protein DICPUDRAFT_90119 [Dictyostelium purpureum]EGC30313.1 hypothetical protein DICPUDRAFT_90119 [Dictyostelium purpureum]|eukprot:XP_003293164.1 hypothetical protein DICPUDRAFT_90119 [Dictyostelium purpureum]
MMFLDSQGCLPLMVQCFICKKILNNPKTLRCSHSFCCDCLELAYSKPSRQYHCRVCGDKANSNEVWTNDQLIRCINDIKNGIIHPNQSMNGHSQSPRNHYNPSSNQSSSNASPLSSSQQQQQNTQSNAVSPNQNQNNTQSLTVGSPSLSANGLPQSPRSLSGVHPLLPHHSSPSLMGISSPIGSPIPSPFLMGQQLSPRVVPPMPLLAPPLPLNPLSLMQSESININGSNGGNVGTSISGASTVNKQFNNSSHNNISASPLQHYQNGNQMKSPQLNSSNSVPHSPSFQGNGHDQPFQSHSPNIFGGYNYSPVPNNQAPPNYVSKQQQQTQSNLLQSSPRLAPNHFNLSNDQSSSTQHMQSHQQNLYNNNIISNLSNNDNINNNIIINNNLSFEQQQILNNNLILIRNNECLIHLNSESQFYCFDCSIGICNNCLNDQHYGHMVQPLIEIFNDMNKESRAFKSILGNIRNKLHIQKEIGEHILASPTDINQQKNRIKNKITTITQQILNQIDNDFNEYKNSIEKRKKIIGQMISEVDDYIRFENNNNNSNINGNNNSNNPDQINEQMDILELSLGSSSGSANNILLSSPSHSSSSLKSIMGSPNGQHTPTPSSPALFGNQINSLTNKKRLINQMIQTSTQIANSPRGIMWNLDYVENNDKEQLGKLNNNFEDIVCNYNLNIIRKSNLNTKFLVRFIYAIGGQSKQSVECYSIQQKKWSYASPMNYHRNRISAVFDGKQYIYVFGGECPGGFEKSVERYCIFENKWTMGKDMPRERSRHATVFDGERYIYIVGGKDQTWFSNQLDRFDIITQEYVHLKKMKIPRSDLSAIYDSRGYIFAIGGFNGKALDVIEQYDIKNDRWIKLGKMRKQRDGPGAVFDGNNYIYVMGGSFGGRKISNNLERMNIDTWEWESLADMKKPIDVRNSAIYDGSGNIYVIGGYFSEVLSETQCYSIDKNEWNYLEPMNEPREGNALVYAEFQV